MTDASKSDDWETPPELIAGIVHRYGPLVLDVAASATNAKAPRFFTKEDNGLAQPWQVVAAEAAAALGIVGGVIFDNCPYSKPNKPNFVTKALDEAAIGPRPVVNVLPADLGNGWFHDAFLVGFDLMGAESIRRGALAGWRVQLVGALVKAEITFLRTRQTFLSPHNPKGEGAMGGTMVAALFPRVRPTPP